MVEIKKAVYSLAKNKAAGPDGCMAGVYQNLHSILKPLSDLLNSIMDTGAAPLPMLKLLIIPPGDAQRDPELCK